MQTEHDGITQDLFAPAAPALTRDLLQPGAYLLRGLALSRQEMLLADVEAVVQRAPFRHLVTPGGFTMSVAMTNCGRLGWVSDRRGYRYDSLDPHSGKPWPAMPESFSQLAREAAECAGFRAFEPEACLINRYVTGARLSLHQDRDERNLDQPIVSVSLGVPATFLFGGLLRTQRPRRVLLVHGDVLVWGGPSRLTYHGVLPLKEARHAAMGAQRINLTFRRAR